MSTLLRRQTHTPHAQFTLYASCCNTSGCMVEWMSDLRPVFEVHRGREWELMDLCFMTCFTGTLPSSVTLAHPWFIPQILILFIQSWQPCIIHASLSICLLCLSWLFFFRFRLYVSVYSCISICMSSSLSHFPHLSLSLLAKKAFALYSLAARQLSKQHRYDFLLACAHLLAPLCWKDEGVSLSFLHVMEVWTLASGTLQPLSVCIKVVHTLWVTYAEKIKQTLIIQCSCL